MVAPIPYSLPATPTFFAGSPIEDTIAGAGAR